MDIILPVAGLGSRLRPLTWNRPKPLVSVGGKTLLAHVVERLEPLDPDQLIFITGFLGDQIEEWTRANFDQKLAFVEQPEMLGQSDAIVRTRDGDGWSANGCGADTDSQGTVDVPATTGHLHSTGTDGR